MALVTGTQIKRRVVSRLQPRNSSVRSRSRGSSSFSSSSSSSSSISLRLLKQKVSGWFLIVVTSLKPPTIDIIGFSFKRDHIFYLFFVFPPL